VVVIGLAAYALLRGLLQRLGRNGGL
jgi:hypothetical protein